MSYFDAPMISRCKIISEYQLAFTCTKLTIETVEQSMKYVQSLKYDTRTCN